jgi:hypothetical protein
VRLLEAAMDRAPTDGDRARLTARLARELHDLLLPYRGRLVIFGGANTVTGPVSHYLGLLATQLEALNDAVRHFQEAIALEERIGALPCPGSRTASLDAPRR